MPHLTVVRHFSDLERGEAMSSRFTKLAALMIGLIASIALPARAQQEIAFLTPEGQTVSLSSMRGKVAALFFGGVQDPQCREELKALRSLAERYQGKGVSICWIS